MEKLNDLKTFEDACKILGIDPATVIAPGTVQEDTAALVALAKLFIIVRAANRLVNEGQDWKPDWNDDDQYKYFAYFWMDDNGSSGFQYLDYVTWYSNTDVGSRLAFKTSEAAEYIGNHFLELYKTFMVID